MLEGGGEPKTIDMIDQVSQPAGHSEVALSIASFTAIQRYFVSFNRHRLFRRYILNIHVSRPSLLLLLIVGLISVVIAICHGCPTLQVLQVERPDGGESG